MTNANNAQVYSYIRFSTPEQSKGHSVERQESFARKIAKDKGLELDEALTMRDEGLSGWKKDNVASGALGKFLLAIQKGKISFGSILVVESLDRISRAEITYCVNIFMQIICAGITVITSMDRKEYNKESLDKNPTEFITMLTVFIRANEESEVKSERVTAVLHDKCKKWLNGERNFKIGSGKAPKWLVWNEEKQIYEFDSYQKQIIEKKIELFSRGYGGLKIAKLLNSEFGEGTVHHTGANIYKEVKRRSLVGELEIKVDGVIYILKDYYPPILTRKQFNNLKSNSKKRGATKYSQKFVGLLSGSGIFKCGVCGRGIKSHVDYRGKLLNDLPAGNKRYMCEEAARQNGCANVNGVQTFPVELAVIRYCQDIVNLERVLTQVDLSSKLSEEKATLEEEKLAIDGELNYLIETATLMKAKPAQLAEKMNSLVDKQENLDKKIDRLTSKLSESDREAATKVVESWKSLTSGFDTQNNDERLALRLLIKDTFNEIRLHPLNRTLESGIAGQLANYRDKMMPCGHNDFIDLTLKFYNGLVRVIRIHKYDGTLIGGVEL